MAVKLTTTSGFEIFIFIDHVISMKDVSSQGYTELTTSNGMITKVKESIQDIYEQLQELSNQIN